MTATPFDSLPRCHGAPQTWPAPQFPYPGVEALFYENVPYKGKATRVFAWIGFPKDATPEKPVPAVVLVHGGGATALANWVRLWNDRGYAAISMDNCGKTPCWCDCPYYNSFWPTHEYSGPAGWDASIRQANDAPEDQWPYHAVAAISGAYDILASYPQVDAARIGLTGISWGGYLTCLAASVDSRFQFAIPVYGCGGFNSMDSFLTRKHPEELRKRWFELWDPDLYLPNAQMPFLWLTDAEDTAYPLDAWRISATLTKNPRTRQSLRTTDYPHNHTQCFKTRTLWNFAAGILDGANFATLGDTVVQGKEVTCTCEKGDAPIVEYCLMCTCASGLRCDQRWRQYPAQFDHGTLSAEVPYSAHTLFFKVTDQEGGVWTSPAVDL